VTGPLGKTIGTYYPYVKNVVGGISTATRKGVVAGIVDTGVNIATDAAIQRVVGSRVTDPIKKSITESVLSIGYASTGADDTIKPGVEAGAKAIFNGIKNLPAEQMML
jgi:hypothetical protein